jgi:hypothetical protein
MSMSHFAYDRQFRKIVDDGIEYKALQIMTII